MIRKLLTQTALLFGLMACTAELVPTADDTTTRHARAAGDYTFTDNFEDSNPSHWQQRYGTSNWSTVTDNTRPAGQQKVFKQTATSGRQWAQLHVFERDLTYLKGWFKVNSASATGEMGWLVRLNDVRENTTANTLEGSWVLLRYNFGSQKYQIYDREERGSTTRQVYSTPATAALATNAWRYFEIAINNASVSLKVGTSATSLTTVASATNLLHKTYGRVGLYANGAVVSYDDVQYAGDEGRVEDGVLTYDTGLDAGLASEWSLARGTSGQLLGSRGGRIYTSTNNGATWDGGSGPLPGPGGGTPHLLRLQSGKLLTLRAHGDSWRQDIRAHSSNTNGEVGSWTERGTLWAGQIAIMPDQIRQVASGRIFVYSRSGNTDGSNMLNRLHYSDDDGSTWQVARTWPDADPNNGKVVDWGTGRLRLIARPRNENWAGTPGGAAPDRLQYCESTNGGTGWGAWQAFTSIVSPTGDFNVRTDPQDADKVYLVWTYNNPAHETNTCGPQAVAPRTRIALARISISANAWTYLADVDDWEYPSFAGPIVQDSRYYNHTLFVDNSFVISTMYRQSNYLQDCDFTLKGRNYSSYFFRKAKNTLVSYGPNGISEAPVHYAFGGVNP